MRETLDQGGIRALKKFYSVVSDEELITEQNYHIEKLQNRLAQLDKSFKGHTIVREG